MSSPEHEHHDHEDHELNPADANGGGATGSLSIEEVRQRLKQQTGKQYWRSLDELAGTPAFDEFLHREFPREASVWDEAFSRRGFLKLMGASLAMAGLSSCTRQPDERMVPYVKPSDQIIPGRALSYASAHVVGGYAMGVLVTSNMGRPTKIEGNPSHPASLGATDIFTQASVLSLYDPDRSKVVVNNGNIRTWTDFTKALEPELNIQKGLKGASMRFLTPMISSPTFIDQMRTILAAYPSAKWHRYDPLGADGAIDGSVMAFGERVETRYAFDKAKVILAIESDFLGGGPASVRYAKDFSHGRKVDELKKEMNRLYAVESAPSLTGANADHRAGVKASQVESFVRALASQLGIGGGQGGGQTGVSGEWLAALVKDLQANHGHSIVIAGESQPAAVHALVHMINDRLGNTGATVFHMEPMDAVAQTNAGSIRDLAADMSAGKVDMLVIIESNPVYDAPVDLGFADLMKKVRFSVRLGMYDDETSSYSHWHLPQSHYLEGWSDARAFDGTVTIIQPLIEPLYTTKSVHEVLNMIAGGQQMGDYEIVQNYWRTKGNLSAPFDVSWRTILNDGLVQNSALPAKNVSLRGNVPASRSTGNSAGFELIFRADPTIADGRYANNGWLQELPKPLTKLTWDNAALISPKDAETQGLSTGDLVDLKSGNRALRVPVMIQPGQPVGTITLYLGYGRTRSGKVGTGTGFNAYTLRTVDAPWYVTGVSLSTVGAKYPLSTTQAHFTMENRDVVRAGTLNEYIEEPNFAVKEEPLPPKDMSLYPGVKYDGYAWGMSIDLTACIGCGACTIACQAENNIPIVGKEQVAKSREMHWIRVDTYFEGGLDDPQTMFQPVPCMHCENAPCEVVCPVGATTHDAEGLNTMVYNRCVGTKYCSNNCPYKVRRFNFLQYSDDDNPTIAMQKNPEVTVRERGVMEKCTFCVQRISHARIEAKREDRPIRDGEVVTACQSVCPASAIVFGDINNKESAVTKEKASPRNYSLLGDLNTRPRTTYLARVRNPNPEIEHLESVTTHG